ncbi:hypothetical protein Ancab_021098 [Ancistrocladus abbreviatus]
MCHASSDSTDEISSDEKFRHIKGLQAQKEANNALTRQGLLKKASDSKLAIVKIPSPAKLDGISTSDASHTVLVNVLLTKPKNFSMGSMMVQGSPMVVVDAVQGFSLF